MSALLLKKHMNIKNGHLEIIKPIDSLLNDKNGFLGVEDSHMIACGVWFEPNPKSYLASKMLEFYKSMEIFYDKHYKKDDPLIINYVTHISIWTLYYIKLIILNIRSFFNG